MAYDIGPRISIKGEKEFNNQMDSINQQLKELGSEMKAVTTEFSENADSQQALISKSRILNQQLDAQKQKYDLLDTTISQHSQILEGLRADYQRVSQESGTTSSEAIKLENAIRREEGTISKLRTSLNETQAYMNKLGTEIGQTDTKLSEIEAGTRDAATGISKLGDEARGASTDLSSLESAARSTAYSELAENVAGAGQAMKGFADEATETVSIYGQLDSASKNAGYTAGETEEIYKQLYSVLGDEQTTATTISNLQALGLEQGELKRLTELTIGAWASYGDSLPIDSLSEAINETVRVGQVTGTFADALNWAGQSEDEFNQKLAQCSTESERARLIFQTLDEQGLAKVAEGFRKSNPELTAYYDASGELNKQQSELAKVIMPGLAAAMEFVSGVLEKVINIFKSFPAPVQTAIGAIVGIVSVIATISPAILGMIGAITLLKNSFTGIISLGTLFTKFSGVVKVALTAIGTAAKGLFTLIMTHPVIAVITAIIAAIMLLYNKCEWFRSGVNGIINKVIGFVKNFGDNVQNVKNSVVTAFTNIVSSIKTKVGNIKDAIVNGFNKAIDFITSLPRKALQWGKDFVQGIINGIKAMIGKVGEAASWVADKIRSFLHFSRPDEGPLREYEKWMPDFMTGLADGMYENIKKVQNAAAAVATTIDSTFTNDVNGIIKGASISNTSTMVIDGDTIMLDGKAIGRSATKYITTTQAAAMASKGRRV